MAITQPVKPAGSFGEYLAQIPEQMKATASSSQRVQLFAKGAPIGWLGENNRQWCVVTDQAAAISIEPYIHRDVLYYRNAADTSRYMSVSDGSNYVGFYDWIGARGWTLRGDVLVSLYTGAQLSYWSTDDGNVYANGASGYTPLTVRFH